jgi:phosphatidate cytidylyltransferase
MLKQRVLTTIIGLPLLIVIVCLGNPWFTLSISALAILAGIEFYRAAGLLKVKPLSFTGLIMIGALCLSYFCPVPDIRTILIIMASVICAVCLLFLQNTERNIMKWLWTMGGIIYIGLMLSFWGELRSLDQGMQWVLWTVVVIMACDIAAFFSGRKWGRHALAPNISPKKTWEGAVGGALASIILGLLLNLVFILPVSWWEVLILSLIVSLLGQAGDLVESVFKRNIGIKDSGHFFPGHGGVLDRIDSYIFTGVLVYYYIIFFVH